MISSLDERVYSVLSRLKRLSSSAQLRLFSWLTAVIKRADAYFSAQSAAKVFSLGLIGVLAVGLADSVTPKPVSFSMLYLIPVMLVSWFNGKFAGVTLSVFGGALWFFNDYHFGITPSLVTALWNAGSRTFILFIVVFLLDYIRDLNRGFEQALSRRSKELKAEVARRLQLEQEIGVISQREQQRIAYELHDGVCQELGALAFQAKLLSTRLKADESALSAEAQAIVDLLNRSMGRTRALSRLLDPLGASNGGLRHSLGQLVDHCGEAYAISCTLDVLAEMPALSHEAELQLYRITQEAIRNAVEHGHSSNVCVKVRQTGDRMALTVSDNGGGFSPEATRQSGLRGMGLNIMNYRASVLGGHLEVQSEPRQGCTIVCSIPLSRLQTIPPVNA